MHLRKRSLNWSSERRYEGWHAGVDGSQSHCVDGWSCFRLGRRSCGMESGIHATTPEVHIPLVFVRVSSNSYQII